MAERFGHNYILEEIGGQSDINDSYTYTIQYRLRLRTPADDLPLTNN